MALNADAQCPACGRYGLGTFYEQPRAPIDSCRIVATRAEALAAGRRPIYLGVCTECGFISNWAYDPLAADPSASYEETQIHSPLFRSFLRELALDLVTRYQLGGKSFLEIGCGNGYFLELMCSLGNSSGVGIDPCYHKGRGGAPGRNIRFIGEHFSQRHMDLVSDFIICRHTLEHIDEVREFVRLVRRYVGDHRDRLVFFEVPDVQRILREVALWDIYHEHCSYFSCGSLARLFRACGFDVVEISRVFDDQYIAIICRPRSGTAASVHGLEEPSGVLAEEIATFARRVGPSRALWRDLVQSYRDSGGVVLWGSGSKAAAFAIAYGLEGQIDFVVNINPDMHGRYVAGTGHQIVPPHFLARNGPGAVISLNPAYSAEIRARIDELGVECDLFTVDHASPPGEAPDTA